MSVRRPSTRLRWRSGKSIETWVGGNDVELYTHGETAFQRMLQAIEGAQRRVWLEMYWFAADGVGLRFFNALRAAASRGVQVAVLYDAWGSFATPRSQFDKLREAGAAVAEFNPITLLQQRIRVAQLTRRNHRKLLIIDGQLGFTGGQNIADEWTVTTHGVCWRDEVIEVRGPVVAALERAFLESWSEQRRLDPEHAERSPYRPAGEPLPAASLAGVNVAVLTQSGLRQRRYALQAYVRRLREATRSIHLANAYFLPNPTITRGLIAAARRGVSVRIIVAGRSDVPIVTLASRAVWARLLRAGVRLYEWNQSVLHSKLAIVDGSWVTAGSFNLDYVSLRRNRELNLAVDNDAFARGANEEFESMVRLCKEVVLETFQRRSWSLRLLERMAYALRTWL